MTSNPNPARWTESQWTWAMHLARQGGPRAEQARREGALDKLSELRRRHTSDHSMNNAVTSAFHTGVYVAVHAPVHTVTTGMHADSSHEQLDDHTVIHTCTPSAHTVTGGAH